MMPLTRRTNHNVIHGGNEDMITIGQRQVLSVRGYTPEQMDKLTKNQASEIISGIFARERRRK